jgi:hypothetical protein
MPAKRPKVSTVPSAVPAYINYKGTKYTVQESRGGKIKITNPKTGANIKLPKGTGITDRDIKFLNASEAIGAKKGKSTEGTRVVKFRGGGAGGAFLENLK